jgi:hypothetical protein
VSAIVSSLPVAGFEGGKSIQFNLYLKRDKKYKLFFGERVSMEDKYRRAILPIVNQIQ